MTSKLSRDELQELRYSYPDDEYDFDKTTAKVVARYHVGDTRWYDLYDVVWQEDDGKYYQITVEIPSTEYQEVDSDLRLQDVHEVEPHEVVTIEYRRK